VKVFNLFDGELDKRRDKLGVWLRDGYQGIFRRGDAVDYWEREG
jgi:hypothetical protein